MQSTWAGKWIAENDMEASVEQAAAGWTREDPVAQRLTALKVTCDTCGGTGETLTGHQLMTGLARGACRTCHGRGSYVPLRIDGDSYRACLMDAYCLIVLGVAELDTAQAYALKEWMA
jgi:hypothetical protein